MTWQPCSICKRAIPDHLDEEVARNCHTVDCPNRKAPKPEKPPKAVRLKRDRTDVALDRIKCDGAGTDPETKNDAGTRGRCPVCHGSIGLDAKSGKIGHHYKRKTL